MNANDLFAAGPIVTGPHNSVHAPGIILSLVVLAALGYGAVRLTRRGPRRGGGDDGPVRGRVPPPGHHRPVAADPLPGPHPGRPGHRDPDGGPGLPPELPGHQLRGHPRRPRRSACTASTPRSISTRPGCGPGSCAIRSSPPTASRSPSARPPPRRRSARRSTGASPASTPTTPPARSPVPSRPITR
jgi:hypothetical protein